MSVQNPIITIESAEFILANLGIPPSVCEIIPIFLESPQSLSQYIENLKEFSRQQGLFAITSLRANPLIDRYGIVATGLRMKR